jgi:redox-sensitive bicupin YhaK (pirin superfamily)
MHSHSNMEILTYVMNGKLKHVDSTGIEGTVEAGDLQRMTAGTGVLHSEYNVSETAPLHFYQVWITPRQHGLEPGYETVTVPEGTGLQLIAAPMEKEEAGAAAIHQDAAVYRGQLPREESLSYEPGTERAVWIQVVDGDLTVADTWLEEGDGIGIGDVEQIVLRAETNTSFLLFDVPTG